MLVVEDFDLVRETIELVLNAEPQIALIGAVATAAEANRVLGERGADIVVIDLSLPDLDGGELCRQIRRSHPRTQCLLFSAAPDEEIIRRSRECGASGYVAKGASVKELVERIKEISTLAPPPVA